MLLLLWAATMTPASASEPAFPHVAWSRNANIYEVNLRQFTTEGSLAAFERHLPRLQKMGVDILWLMPLHPIGEKNRKGSLGSYYSVRDHRAVNPELGTLADLKRVVRAAHALGMHVILDWVANHTAWDHAWVAEHPGWYKKGEKGKIHSYVYDTGRKLEHWTDVVGLDYRRPELWTAMIEAMSFWVREADVDGFRCDVAKLVPTPFWERAREALEGIKPVFLLAEAAEPELHHNAFDMTYDWDLYDAMRSVARGEGDAREIRVLWQHPKKRFPGDAYRMLFTGNHDSNAWTGSDAELYGPAFRAFAVLAATLPGMPLVYGGQEAFYEKRLAFFAKDPIDWKRLPLEAFYAELLHLKKRHAALWNGQFGGDLAWLEVENTAALGFERRRNKDLVRVVVNLSGKRQTFTLGGERQQLEAWAWRIVEL